jgi:hypothetical protein
MPASTGASTSEKRGAITYARIGIIAGRIVHTIATTCDTTDTIATIAATPVKGAGREAVTANRTGPVGEPRGLPRREPDAPRMAAIDYFDGFGETGSLTTTNV